MMMEEEEEEEAHAEALARWQAGLAQLVRDPLLCDLPAQVTPEEICSQVALEYGQAMTVRVRRVDASEAPMRNRGGGAERERAGAQEGPAAVRAVAAGAPGRRAAHQLEARLAHLQSDLRRREAGGRPQEAAGVRDSQPG